ncbi:MAG: fibronectin type III domain-containing protein, partial [Desulfobacterales bacterium]
MALILGTLIFLISSLAQAAITTVASNVSPGWSNNRKTVVFYNGTRFFLLYNKGGADIYYQSSTDNVTWSGESTLIGGASRYFNIYPISDTKFDLVYYGSPNTTYVRTCTISGATITAGSASTVEAIAHDSLAVARSGAGDRIYVVGMFNNDFLRVYSADQTGDADGVTTWTKEVNDSSVNPDKVAIVPYQSADEVLVIYTLDGGGTNNDGVYSRVITHLGGAGSETECGNFDSLPDFSNPIRISDTDFRITITPPAGSMVEYQWDDTLWSLVATVDAGETDQASPGLYYDRISGDMYLFSVDTGTDDVERYYKPNGGSWQAEVVADGGEASAHSYPITQMSEPPAQSARTSPRELVWAYRVLNGANYDLKVGTLTTSGGAIYYVRTDGNDTNTGLGNSPSEAWRNIQKAADTMVAGDKVYVVGAPTVAGIYNEEVVPLNGGTAANPITYEAVGTVILDGQDAVCGTRQSAFRLTAKDYIVINGFEFTDYQDCGGDDATVYVLDSDYVQVINSVIHDTGRDAIGFRGTSSNCLSQNNLIYNIDDDGISPIGSGNHTVRNNTVYNCDLNVSGSGYAMEGANTAGNVYENNIFWHNIDDTTVATYAYNDYINAVLPGSGNIQLDPLFVNPATDDFHLSYIPAGQAGNSPAIDAGGVTAASLGLDTRTTRTDAVVDSGTVDLGYHYPNGSPDSTPPAAISDLAIGTITSTTIQLTWTAPGDDDTFGTATTYDIRYSTSPITAGNWASATQATGEPAPQVAGSSESFTVTGLSPDTTYYFAIQTADEVPNWSTLSNVMGAATSGMIARWPLDETVGTNAAEVLQGNDGTYQNGVTLNQPGACASTGTSVSFNSALSQYVEIPHSDDYLLDEGTATFWAQATGTASNQGLFSKDSTGNDTGGHL